MTGAVRATPPAGGALLPSDVVDLQLEARGFALERLRPRAAELEWQRDPADRVDWELVEEASARGWRTLGLAEGTSVLGLCVLIEELAYGDMGFAVLMDQTLKVQRVIDRLGVRADPRRVLRAAACGPADGARNLLHRARDRLELHPRHRLLLLDTRTSAPRRTLGP